MDETDQAQAEAPKDGSEPEPQKPARTRKKAFESKGSGEVASIVVEGERRSVVERLIAVLADVPDLPKDRNAPENMGGYAFRGIETITTAMRPLMAKHGVICLAKVRKRIESERRVGRENKVMYVVDLHIDWTFHGADGDTLTADSWGCGTDMGDKATQKAVTAAFKSLLTPTFFIGDGGTDAESHSVAETEGGQRRTRQRRQSTNKAPDPPPPPPPAPVDPEQWFAANGWMDQQHHDEERKVVVDTAASMPEQAKAVFKAWCENHEPPVDFKKAWPAPLVEEMRDYLKAIAKLYAPPAPQPGPPIGQKAPEAPEATQEAPAAPSGPLTCVWCHKPVSEAVAVPGQAEGRYHPACADEELAEIAEQERAASASDGQASAEAAQANS